jgi:hypothetical protein
MSRFGSARGIRASVVALTLMAALGAPGTATAAVPGSIVRNLHLHPSFTIYDCGDFEVEAAWDVSLSITEFYDGDGNLVRAQFRIAYDGDMWNADTGASVRDRGVHTVTDDLRSGQTRDAGGYRHITAPGEGALLLDVGNITTTWNDPSTPLDDLLRFAGPHHEVEAALGPLCDYLRG